MEHSFSEMAEEWRKCVWNGDAIKKFKKTQNIQFFVFNLLD